MISHWSLISFTLLIQAAIGSVWCSQLALYFNPGSQEQPVYQVIAAFVLTVTGMLISLGHLGNPLRGVFAVRNLKQSWLSREISTVSLFAGLLAAWLVFDFLQSGMATSMVLLSASITGAILLQSMSSVYRLRTVPAWNHPGTNLAFWSAALTLGTVLFFLAELVSAGIHGTGPLHGIAGGIGLVVACLGHILRILATGFGGSGRKNQPVIQGIGLTLWVVSMVLPEGRPISLVLFLIGAGCLIVGEINQRIRFYQSYQRTGL